MRQPLSKIGPNIWLILVLPIFAWGPLLTLAYFFNAHDAKHSVFFLVEFDQTFRDGYLWPRWSPDFSFGYGYPLFNLYAPLAFYGAEIFHILGMGFAAAIKMMYILATIAAGLGMYGFVRRLYGGGGSRRCLMAGVGWVEPKSFYNYHFVGFHYLLLSISLSETQHFFGRIVSVHPFNPTYYLMCSKSIVRQGKKDDAGM